MRIKIDKNIKSSKSNWKFDKNVAKNFDSHVTKSVPFYNISHDLCVSLSEFFLKDKSRCYDIGCSNGTLLNKIKSKNNGKKIDLIGIDIILVANNHKDNEEFLFNNLRKNKDFKKFIIDCWSIINKDKCQYYNYKYKNISSK